MEKILREITRALLTIIIVVLAVAIVVPITHHIFYIWLEWNIIISILIGVVIASPAILLSGRLFYPDCK